ncbi:MAG: DUF2779 domain-containing protein [Eubacteriales bacterium]|nr:DUF2779 domain-containing protein [Eubacteriales bacterium]
MQPFTIHDLLTFRKCPRAAALRRMSGTQTEPERKPLSIEAARSLRSLDQLEADAFHVGLTIRKNHAQARADLLIHRSDGWELLLDTNAQQLREAHVWEAAFVSHLCNAVGLPVRRVTALLIDPNYVRTETIDYGALYIEQEITERAKAHIGAIRTTLQQMNEQLNAPDAPEHELFEGCLKPRECPFWEECSAHVPKLNVFSIAGMSNRRKFQLYRSGVSSFTECLAQAKLPKPQKMQVMHELEQRPPLINRPSIAKFLRTLWYPVRFLDFESYQPAVPPYSGMKPFTQCAFLYSVHGLDSPSSPLEHAGVFVPYGTDPRRQIALGLCRDIPQNACVVVYSSGLEKAVVRELAGLYPDLRAHLMQIAANMRDLLGPFRERAYYDRRMEGSCSLKRVLPAMDARISYGELTGVQNGEDAVRTYEAMAALPPEKREETARQLREYCALDTLAMALILKKLEDTQKQERGTER